MTDGSSGGAAPSAVLHVALGLSSLGGTQAVVRHHLATDGAEGLSTWAVGAFDGPEGMVAGDPRARLLGLTWRHSVSAARARFRVAAGRVPTPVAVYHDLWGLPFLADLDGARRRLGVIHCPAPPVLAILGAHHHLLDGVACVGAPALEAVRRVAPALPADRLVWLPIPVNPPAAPGPEQPPLAGRPLVLGYSGRLTRELKRVDRLPALATCLREAGLPLRLEILGDGPERGRLVRALRGQGDTVFHGRRDGSAYWDVLTGWDALVYLSDVEGLGLALLEGMSVGVLPLYPRIGGGGEPYVAAVHPDLLYPPGSFGHLADVLGRLRAAPAAEVALLRARCRHAVRSHLGRGYSEGFVALLRAVLAAPRRSVTPPPRRSAAIDRVPFAILRRLGPGAPWRTRKASVDGPA